ncbi:MAG TPA: vWA domain-containing protein, partial [Acidisoma sp.]|nr:vWA domain-containing protein [Acidisoma sp.]
MVDHSGSMGDGFRKSAEQASFRDRQTQQTLKLQAAVESVLIELPRLPARSDVTLCGFTSSARVLHRGPAGDQVGFATALQGLNADGGTDIAAALDSARTQVFAAKRPSPAPDIPEANRIMLITDGLSDREKARQAARRCARDGLTVDVILIDPIDQAQELAAAVAGETNGRWEPVFGPEDLSRAAAEARAAMEIEAQQTGEAARAAAAETAAIRAERAARDAVLFRASHPGALTADAWYPLVVHVYAERMEGELKARLAELAPSLGPQPRRTEVPAGSAIPPGTELEIQPVIEHVRCRPLRIPVIWAEQLEEARFEIAYADPTGSSDVCHGDVLILA